jgi:hypothetical protein
MSQRKPFGARPHVRCGWEASPSTPVATTPMTLRYRLVDTSSPASAGTSRFTRSRSTLS